MPRSYEEILDVAVTFNGDAETGEYIDPLTDEDYQVVIDRFVDDPMYVMRPGHTNDECVNLGIACVMLGVDFEDFVASHYEGAGDYYRVMEHVRRIQPYLETWKLSGCAPLYMVKIR